MKFILVLLIEFLLIAVISGPTNATLIGDTVYSKHVFLEQTLGNIESAIVSDDSADIMIPHPSKYYTVDVGSDLISILFQTGVEWCCTRGGVSDPEEFNGVKIWDLNDSTGGVIKAIEISVSQELGIDYNSDWVTFADHGVNVNWNGLIVPNGTSFTIKMDFDESSPVPEPSTLILLGIGLFALAGIHKKKVIP